MNNVVHLHPKNEPSPVLREFIRAHIDLVMSMPEGPQRVEIVKKARRYGQAYGALMLEINSEDAA